MAIKKGQMTDNETGDLLYFQTSYDMVTDKPTNFPPSSHNHDDRYYTEAEINMGSGTRTPVLPLAAF